MIVDPNTGMIVGYSDPTSAPGVSTGAEIAMSGAAAAGLGDSTVMGMLEHMPSAWATMGWNASRGGNTITRGPKGAIPFTGRHLKDPGAIRTTFNPRYFGRYGSYNALGGGFSMPDGAYSPLNVLHRASNWGIGKAVDREIASGAAGRLRSAGIYRGLADVGEEVFGPPSLPSKSLFSRVPNRPSTSAVMGKATLNIGEEGSTYASAGLLGRATAAAKVRHKWGSTNLQPGRFRSGNQAKVMNFLKSTDFELRDSLRGRVGQMTGQMTGKEMSSYILMSQKGTVNQYIGGYLSRATGSVSDEVLKTANTLGRTAFTRGSEKAAAHMGGSMAAKSFAATAKTAANFIPYVNLAMKAWMVYDLMKMGMASLAKAPDFARDAAVSFRGQLNKPVMGMGFKDNTVAATSRQRGVMAIQNSRLNARSILGSEASQMHAHFG